MTDAPAELLSLLLLAGCLLAAVLRPKRLPEALVAVPAAVLLLGLGVVSRDAAGEELRRLLPVVVFLALILVLAHLADVEGVFTALGARLARAGRRGPGRLLVATTVVAAAVTAALSLDATAVLLTPVVLAASVTAGVPAREPLVLTGQLSNAGSLLLPVSNLTNLLAVAASGLSFARFAALMAGPWVAAVAVCLAVAAWRARGSAAVRAAGPDAVPPLPRRPVLVLAAVLVGFVACSAVGVPPALAALAGCLALGYPALARGRTSARRLVSSAALGFCAFVLALGVVVRAVSEHGLGHLVDRVLPTGESFLALLGAAAVAALLANVVNNLPATLLMLPAAGTPALVLAVLLGVTVGPNLTPAGSLASLLWRRSLRERGSDVGWRPFLAAGAVAAPLGVVAATAALWAALHVVGV